jgi:hypothetical protein
MDDANLIWTLSMSFYASSEGFVCPCRNGEYYVLQGDVITYLAEHEPASLIPLQRLVLQNPDGADAIGKVVMYIQAIWFFS